MLTHTSLSPAPGSHSHSKRLGRGNGSGKGSKSWRGINGQNSRSGAHFRLGEQTTYIERMPKARGFRAVNTIRYIPINLSTLEALVAVGITEITPEILLMHRIIRNPEDFVKILGGGELSAKITVSAHAFSVEAKTKIEKAGGTVIVLARK